MLRAVYFVFMGTAKVTNTLFLTKFLECSLLYQFLTEAPLMFLFRFCSTKHRTFQNALLLAKSACKTQLSVQFHLETLGRDSVRRLIKER